MLRIAIDGTASAGKGSIAREVARRLDIAYIDTGAMYRAIGLRAFQRGIDWSLLQNEDPQSLQQIKEILQNVHFDFFWNQDKLGISFNGEDISLLIRSEEVGQMASIVSKIPQVREILSAIQKKYVSQSDLVMDGRDIGTIIIPDAELKVFVDADLSTRAYRRQQELLCKGQQLSLEEVELDLQDRDFRDRNRSIAPLIQAKDAHLLDTTDLDIEGGVQQILQWVQERDLYSSKVRYT